MTPRPSHSIRFVFGSALQVLVLAFLLVFMGMVFWESDLNVIISFYFLVLIVGRVNPWWALIGVAILGPLSLLSPGSTHRLLAIDVLLTGALVGHVVRGLRSAHLRPLYTDSSLRPVAPGEPDPPPAGYWPHLGWILAFGILATALPGLQVGFVSSEPKLVYFHWMVRIEEAVHGYPTSPWWPVRSAFNWISGLLICWVAFQWATPRRVRVLLLYAGAVLTLACLVGLGSRFHIWDLDAWRRPNPDYFHMRFHRLNGLAGHAGWMAEWIVLTGPGLLLLWGPGRKRRIASAGAGAIVALTLLLTLARAAWLAAALVVVVLILLRFRSFRLSRKATAIGLGVVAVVFAISLAVGSRSLLFRLSHATDFRDRLNYVASTAHLLRLSPLGLGIGMHGLIYDSLFAPVHRFWQFDHSTAHNTWLHLAAEQGPMQAALVALGGLALLIAAWRAWRRADPERRPLLLVLLLVFVGLAAESMAQYLPLIRAVEAMIWILAGCLIRLSRDVATGAIATPATSVASTPSMESSSSNDDFVIRDSSFATPFLPSHFPLRTSRSSWVGALILLAGAVPAVVVAAYHARRDASEPYPRALLLGDDGQTVETWTTPVWRFPIEPDWCGIEFSLICSRYPQDVEILLPDNAPYRAHFDVDEQRGFWFAFRPATPVDAFTPLRWMEIRSIRPWTPALSDPGATDRRRLGIYVIGLRPFYCDADPRRPDTQEWTESVGGMVPMLPAPEPTPTPTPPPPIL